MKVFNQVEYTLREGENELSTRSKKREYTNFENEDNHLYLAPLQRNTISWDNSKVASNDSEGHYVIEYLGVRAMETESASHKENGGLAGSSFYLSRVIAKANKKATGATRTIKTTYATINQP